MVTPQLISRRKFLASGIAASGGLFVAMSFAGAAASFKPSAYIEIGPGDRVTFTIGKSEMGQGTQTGIAQLIADELGCAWSQIRVVQAPSDAAFGLPFNGFMITGGSSGLRTEWQRMRKMGAAARLMLQQAAAQKWQVEVTALHVESGVVTGPGHRRANFAELSAAAAHLPIPKDPPLKPKAARRFIGKPMPRLDTQEKIAGQARYGLDVALPGMLTAVLIAPPRFGAQIQRFDGRKALAKPGIVAVEEISAGVAIVGEHFWAVHSARADIEIDWTPGPFDSLDMDTLRAGYQAALEQEGKVAEETGENTSVDGGQTIERTFEQPYLAHACMEPMNMTVHIRPGVAEVWGPTQAQTLVQKTVGNVAGLDPKAVRVHTTFLGGGFGRRSAQDFVQAAAEIAMRHDRPVKLVYSREDDMRAGRYRPFNLTRAKGTLDQNGALAALEIKVATPSVSKWSGLLFLINKEGVDQQAVEGLVGLPYAIPSMRVEWVDHDPQIPVHFWRAVGASHNPFVIESLLDDLAYAAGKNPLEFRRALLAGQPRHLAVLDRLANASGWSTPPLSSVGRGMALVQSFESIAAQAVELRLIDGAVAVEKVTCVVDCGIAINPNQIEAQMQSSIAFALSAVLRGEITLSEGAVDQSNFHDYEPLRLPEMPVIDVHILEGDEKLGGVGEPGLPPLLPALGNALFALTGKRTTRLPIEF